MRVAYLVLAHQSPGLLRRVIGRLSTENCAFFIHIDQKSDLGLFAGIAAGNVFFSDARVPVYWGEFSVVEAILLLLHQALRGSEDFEYFVLISGSDYPIRSVGYIQRYLEVNRDQEYMSLTKAPAPGRPLSRINTLRFPRTQPARWLVFRALAKLGMAERDYKHYLGTLEPYTGSMWWALTRQACEYIVTFNNENPWLRRYFLNVFAADEAFFHTIIGNSPFISRIRRNLHYEDWPGGSPHPNLIDDRHVAFMESQDAVCVSDLYGSGEALFARKFSEHRIDVLQRIDEMVRCKERL